MINDVIVYKKYLYAGITILANRAKQIAYIGYEMASEENLNKAKEDLESKGFRVIDAGDSFLEKISSTQVDSNDIDIPTTTDDINDSDKKNILDLESTPVDIFEGDL